MKDPRHQKLAELLVQYSVSLQKGESCLIQAVDTPVEMVEALVEAVYAEGGYPQVSLMQERLHKTLLTGSTRESIDLWAECDVYRMKRMDAFIGIRGYENPRETSLIGDGQNREYMRRYFQPGHLHVRVPSTKWAVLRYPTAVMAYMAGMPTEEFEDYYYQVTSGVDYRKMSQAMKPAKQFLDRCREVHIVSEHTDLRFSIEGMGSVPCDGRRNIPDGEIYTAPVRESVEGYISYNTSSTYQGTSFSDVRFEFSRGKIVDAQAHDTEKINRLLDCDEGARYIGEFALGCNPRILKAIDETLFDEKIMGSFHFTPGAAYKECDNGNRSSLHWDLVCLQTPEYGGGEIWIDGELIRKDGIFVHEAFAGLNPEFLTGERDPE